MKNVMLSLILSGALCAQTAPVAPLSVTVSHINARVCDVLDLNLFSISCEWYLCHADCRQGVLVIVASPDPKVVAFQVTVTYTNADSSNGTESTFIARTGANVSAFFPLTDVTNIKAQAVALSPYAVVNAAPLP